MGAKGVNSEAAKAAQDREARRKAALKANIARRKAQARARAAATSRDPEDESRKG